VGCWAHARRKYDEALKAESKNKGRTHKAISFISKLYKLKTQAKNKKLSPQARYQLRQEKSLPILIQFKTWLDDGKLLTENPAILIYLNSLMPGSKLLPSTEDIIKSHSITLT